MKRDLVKRDTKNDAFSRILRFMQHGDLVLRSDEELILDRWIYCNTLKKSRKYRDEDIVSRIVEKFGVSKFTALSDISNTQALFGAALTINKEYLLHHHIEDISLTIKKAESDPKLAAILPKLYDAYTKAILALPDQLNQTMLPPPIIIVNIVQGQTLDIPLTPEEAMREADELIEFEKNFEYTEFEEVKDDDK